jgi:hypothetical protein
VNPAAEAKPHRFELTLRRPRFGWFPKPTVVFDGRGQPAQWGTGTWRLPDAGTMTVSVYLFNRLWTYGAAEFVIDGANPVDLAYSAPWLPFLGGKIEIVSPGRAS